MTPEITQDHEVRLSSLESEIRDLKDVVKEHMALSREETRETNKSIRDLADAMNAKVESVRRPFNPAVPIAGGALLISIMSVLGSMALNPIREKIESNISAVHSVVDIARAHEAKEGHAGIIARVSTLESEVERRVAEINGQFSRVADSVNRGQAEMAMGINLTRREQGLETMEFPTYVLFFNQ